MMQALIAHGLSLTGSPGFRRFARTN